LSLRTSVDLSDDDLDRALEALGVSDSSLRDMVSRVLREWAGNDLLNRCRWPTPKDLEKRRAQVRRLRKFSLLMASLLRDLDADAKDQIAFEQAADGDKFPSPVQLAAGWWALECLGKELMGLADICDRSQASVRRGRPRNVTALLVLEEWAYGFS
jgi:hypothetical protein